MSRAPSTARTASRRQLAALGTTGAAASLSRIFESVDRFAGAAPQYDDITCLVLRVAAAILHYRTYLQ